MSQEFLNHMAESCEAVYMVWMNEAEALRVMSALAQTTRMSVFVMLARTGHAGMGSSDIADAVGVPRNLMSSHLAVLSRAGVIASKKTGRSVIYTAVGSVVVELSDHLRDLGESTGPQDGRADRDVSEAP